MITPQVITFYSYKGGVGRSMAVANIATLLAKHHYRILVVDFDLDAPGLHRYFLNPRTRFEKRRYTPSSSQGGVIDFFVQLRDRLETAFPGAGTFDPKDEQALDICRKIVRDLIDDDLFGYRVTVAVDASKEATIQFLPAGDFDEDYSKHVRGFNWQLFFEEFSEVFEMLRTEWKRRYDYVLVDSRTGLTDIGNITSVVLPDRLVVVFSPNDQSLHGAVEVARQAVRLHADVTNEPLAIFPLMARVELAEAQKKKDWMVRAAESFSRLFADLYAWKTVDLGRYFESVHIPHSSYYAYGEQIAVEEHKGWGFGSLGEAYGRFLECLQYASIAEWLSRSKLSTTTGGGDHAVLVGFDASFQPPTRLMVEQIIRIPETLTEGGWTALRSNPVDRDVWTQAAQEIDQRIERAKIALRGNLHIFVMAPYAIAVLVGRRLDALARAVPIYIYQFNAETRDWMLFSAPSTHVPIAEIKPFFHDLEHTVVDSNREDVVVVIEGTRKIQDDNLRDWAIKIGAGRIARLRQLTPQALGSLAEARSAVAALRRAFEDLQQERPNATFHIVTTAPNALLVELGRMLTPTVYRSAIVHQYDAATATYSPVFDVITGLPCPAHLDSKPAG